MRRAFCVNKYQSENPCFRRCPGERTGDCHATCDEYAKWDQEQKRRKEHWRGVKIKNQQARTEKRLMGYRRTV